MATVDPRDIYFLNKMKNHLKSALKVDTHMPDLPYCKDWLHQNKSVMGELVKEIIRDDQSLKTAQQDKVRSLQ